jgi:alanyl-tRNA synthetase
MFELCKADCLSRLFRRTLLQIWNLVFVQYNKDKSASARRLAKWHIDTVWVGAMTESERVQITKTAVYENRFVYPLLM